MRMWSLERCERTVAHGSLPCHDPDRSHSFSLTYRTTAANYSSPLQDFKSAATGVAAKAMRNELNRMVQDITDDPEFKNVSHILQK
jgi:hypothetical protein